MIMKQKRFFPICAGFFWPLRLCCFICRYFPALYDGIVNRFASVSGEEYREKPGAF